MCVRVCVPIIHMQCYCDPFTMEAFYSPIFLSQLLLHLFPVCDGSMQTLIGKTGESVTLPCRYDYTAGGLTTMCWGRAEVPMSKCSNTIVSTDGEKVTFRKSSRYWLRKRVEKGDVSLTIVNLTENDSGVYGCRVEIPGWLNDLKLNFNLTIYKAEDQGTMQFVPAENTTDKTTAGTRSTASDHSTESSLLNTTQYIHVQQSTGCSDQESIQSQEEDHRLHLHAAILVPLLSMLLLVAMFLLMIRIRKQNKGWLFQKVQKSSPSSVFYINYESTLMTQERETVEENIYQ